MNSPRSMMYCNTQSSTQRIDNVHIQHFHFRSRCRSEKLILLPPSNHPSLRAVIGYSTHTLPRPCVCMSLRTKCPHAHCTAATRPDLGSEIGSRRRVADPMIQSGGRTACVEQGGGERPGAEIPALHSFSSLYFFSAFIFSSILFNSSCFFILILRRLLILPFLS